jgi:phosphate transport system substrate-binding protein
MENRMTRFGAAALALAFLAACGGGDTDGSDAGTAGLTGSIEIDGSSTVFPVAAAVAEEFQIANPDTRVTVAYSGTGGGFQRFCAGETDMSNASRPIRDSEAQACHDAGVEFTELNVGWDGLSVLANPDNEFLQCLTVGELNQIWEPNSTVTTWQDVRDEWPAEEISLYGPGTDSGTFDYFTETINGEGGASRADYQASEDDNILVQGIAGDRYSLGYFGYAYYAENSDILKLVGVDGGEGCVLPSDETIQDGTYAPLSRPLYVYVRHSALERPAVRAYVDFMLGNAPDIVPSTGYSALSAEQYADQMQAIAEAAGGAS